MAETKGNKNANVRLPTELLVELRKEQAPYLARGEEAPSLGSMLLDAWRTSRSNRADDDEDPYIHKLRTILETGTEREKDAVKKGIDLILSPAAASRPARARRKVG